MSDERRYSERQMAVLLRLAAELDTGRLGERTLAEIEEIAAEAGISLEAVRAAAARLDEEQPGWIARLLGAPTTFRYERIIPGARAKAELHEIVAAFRWSSGLKGDVVELGDGVGWQRKTEEGPLTQLEVAPHGDQTRIRLLGRWEDPASWIVVAGGAATAAITGLGIAALDPSLAGSIGITGGAAAASWLGMRAWWKRLSASVRRRLVASIDELENHTRSIAAKPEDVELPAPGSDRLTR